MSGPVRPVAVQGGAVWGRPMGVLALFIFGPLLLIPTPLRGLGITWATTCILLLLLTLWAVGMSLLIGIAFSQPPGMLLWLEQRLRLWAALFAVDPVPLWIHWARQASRPEQARWCLEQAVLKGSAEAMFQQGLAYLEGGFGAGGQGAAMLWLRRAAERNHPEAAFRLAEGLRTRLGQVRPAAGEAERWYQRSASLGFGPAATWLAQAYASGDGVTVDETKATYWLGLAQRLQPHPGLSRCVLRHDAAPEDPLLRVFAGVNRGLGNTADRLLAHRHSRWVLLGGGALLGVLALVVAGAFFWAGSSGLHHLPLLMLLPPGLLLAWQAYQLRKEGPRVGRDRLLEAAEAGDPEACYELGVAYRRGSAIRPRDDLSATIWFRRAAEGGHPLAMIALADAYLGGHGVLRDAREAARWAEAARRESTSESK